MTWYRIINFWGLHGEPIMNVGIPVVKRESAEWRNLKLESLLRRSGGVQGMNERTVRYTNGSHEWF